LLWKVKKTNAPVAITGGETLIAPIMYGKNTTAGSMGAYDPVPLTAQTGLGHCAVDWKQLSTSVVLDKATMARNAGPDAKLSILKGKMKQAEMSLQDAMVTQLFSDGTGNGGLDITGIRLMCGTTSTYAGLAGSGTYSWWSAVVDTTSEALKINGGTSSMEYIYQTCAQGQGKASFPDIGCTTLSLYQSYIGQLQPQQRFEDKEMADAGFANVMFHGMPIVWDNACTATYFYMLNSNFLNFCAHTSMGANGFKVEAPLENPGAQLVRAWIIWWYGNLITNCRRAHGLLTTKT